MILDYLSKLLSTEKSSIERYINTAPHRYKKYEIDKRNGAGKRKIAQPAKELKALQKLVYQQYLSQLPVHACCTAYKKDINIKDNAAAHVGGKYFLKLDFKDFFPSIKPKDLALHVDKYLPGKISEKDKNVLKKLFFYDPDRISGLCLSIGAPTSPILSNSILFDFDKTVSAMCAEKKVVYTRYADDLAFSTTRKGVLFELFPEIVNIAEGLEYPRLKVNEQKTVFLSRSGNVHITGLVLTNDSKVSLGRDKKRYVRALVHKYVTHAITPEDKAYLEGYLAFCFSVEPTFIKSLEAKYGNGPIHDLLHKR